MVDGLWQGPNAITQNFQAIVWRIKLLGFNTVRLPFSFQARLCRNRPASSSTLSQNNALSAKARVSAREIQCGLSLYVYQSYCKDYLLPISVT